MDCHRSKCTMNVSRRSPLAAEVFLNGISEVVVGGNFSIGVGWAVPGLRFENKQIMDFTCLAMLVAVPIVGLKSSQNSCKRAYKTQVKPRGP